MKRKRAKFLHGPFKYEGYHNIVDARGKVVLKLDLAAAPGSCKAGDWNRWYKIAGEAIVKALNQSEFNKTMLVAEWTVPPKKKP